MGPSQEERVVDGAALGGVDGLGVARARRARRRSRRGGVIAAVSAGGDDGSRPGGWPATVQRARFRTIAPRSVRSVRSLRRVAICVADVERARPGGGRARCRSSSPAASRCGLEALVEAAAVSLVAASTATSRCGRSSPPAVDDVVVHPSALGRRGCGRGRRSRRRLRGRRLAGRGWLRVPRLSVEAVDSVRARWRRWCRRGGRTCRLGRRRRTAAGRRRAPAASGAASARSSELGELRGGRACRLRRR